MRVGKGEFAGKMELIRQVGSPFFHTHLRRVRGGGQFTPLASRFYRWRGARGKADR